MACAKKTMIFAVLILCGAVTAPAAAAETPSAAVRIYEAGALVPERYTVIKRLWVESWRSAFWVPTHGESAAAIAELQAEAARLGADGIVNLHCLNSRGGWFSGADAFFCYGNAVRLKL